MEEKTATNADDAPGRQIYELIRRLFPLPRSLTGNGVRDTLTELKKMLPSLSLVEVPSGTKAFDWEVPPEWNIRDAHIIGPSGETVVDFSTNNLHVMAYSEPVDAILTREQLDEHLHSLPDQPDAIPFVMSYYNRSWGFSLPHSVRTNLPDGDYSVFIDSTLEPGSLSYGELILPGREATEILLSTYVCHPSMANDNLSGIAVTAFLARWLSEHPDQRHTYRIIFIPETIGSIVYLSRHLQTMRRNTVAGFVVTCCGDERAYSFLPSRRGNTPADRVARHVIRHHAPDCIEYTYLDRGSDERQYCSPGVDLPVVSLMRSKYREYPEYHTSNDNLDLVTPAGLGGSFELYQRCIVALERNLTYSTVLPCEPQLGRRGLFPTLSIKRPIPPARDLLNLLSYCDGEHDLIAIAAILGRPVWDLYEVVRTLVDAGLIADTGTLPNPQTPDSLSQETN